LIKSFKHKGLEKFYLNGSTAGIQAKHSRTLGDQLAALDTAAEIGDMNIPGWGLHPLKGKMDEKWAISVNKNWRLTFKFENGNAYIVNYEDYH
jgi:proteic killer suppression protein